MSIILYYVPFSVRTRNNMYTHMRVHQKQEYKNLEILRNEKLASASTLDEIPDKLKQNRKMHANYLKLQQNVKGMNIKKKTFNNDAMKIHTAIQKEPYTRHI